MADDPMDRRAADDSAMVHDAPVGDDPGGADLGLRTTGFLITVLGALVAGIGSVLDWILVTIAGVGDDLAPTWRGLDTVGGKVALVAAVVALIAVLTSRVGATATARRGAAVVVVAAGLAIVAAAAYEALTAEDRYVADAIAQARDTVASLGIPSEDLDAVLDQLQGLLEVHLQLGVWVTLAGGVITAAGGAVTLAWVRRRNAPTGAAMDGLATGADLATQEPRSPEPPATPEPPARPV